LAPRGGFEPPTFRLTALKFKITSCCPAVA